MFNIKYEGFDFRWVRETLTPELQGLAKVFLPNDVVETVDLVVLDEHLPGRLAILVYRHKQDVVVVSRVWKDARTAWRGGALEFVHKEESSLRQQFEYYIFPKLKRASP